MLLAVTPVCYSRVSYVNPSARIIHGGLGCYVARAPRMQTRVGRHDHGEHRTARPTSRRRPSADGGSCWRPPTAVVLRDGPEASMNAIAAEAGITKPILYRHFGDKGGLYRALAKRHTDALLAQSAGRAGRPRPAAGPGRGHPGRLPARDRGPPAGLPLPDAPVRRGQRVRDRASTSARHSAPLLRRLGEELAKVIADRVDLGPDSELMARVWGHGIVGMMHAAGDWWLRRTPLLRASSWYAASPTCSGAAGRGRGPRGRPGLLSSGPRRAAEAPPAQRPDAPAVAAHGALAAARSARRRRSPVRRSTYRPAVEVVALVLQTAGEETGAGHRPARR